MPYELTVLLLIDCDNCPSLELELHKRFATKRVRGEWFRLSDEDMEEMQKMYGPHE